LVSPEIGIDEELKKDILGARNKILFVEGSETSLDKALYSLIFPEVTIVPKASCRDVIHSVKSIRNTETIHRLEAWGIIDNDGRTPDEIQTLNDRGINTLECFSVESIYYHPQIIEIIAKNHCDNIGGDPDQIIQEAKTAAFEAIPKQIDRLCAKVVEKSVRENLLNQLPSLKDIKNGKPVNINLDVASMHNNECEKLNKALAEKDLNTIISRYPIRETNALNEIVDKLKFRDSYQTITIRGAFCGEFAEFSSALALIAGFAPHPHP